MMNPRRLWIAFLVVLFFVSHFVGLMANVTAACLNPPGDVDASGVTNIVDTQCTIVVAVWTLQSLGDAPTCAALGIDAADVDCSGSTTIVDVILVIKNALAAPLDPALDSDSNQCVDTCQLTQTNCCVEGNTPGCGESLCEDCVCGLFPECCTNQWGALCALFATELCTPSCPCFRTTTDQCCEPHPSAGCENATCSTCVCDHAPECCTDGWGPGCVNVGKLLCGAECACGLGTCCTPHDQGGCGDSACETTVCALNPACCLGKWSDSCADLATQVCVACGAPELTCCAPHPGPGCTTTACQSCICALDPWCCAISWDGVCTMGAMGDECASVCPCTPDCCVGSTNAECADSDCRPCVCAQQPDCCQGPWTDTCAALALQSCGIACGCTDVGCCQAQLTPGCNDPGCAGCVCAIDPSCCLLAWDDHCAEFAAEVCGNACPECAQDPPDCCPAEPTNPCCQAHGAPGCAIEDCETMVCETDEFCCTTMWDSHCAQAAANSCGELVESDKKCVPNCCVGGETPGCAGSPQCEVCVCTQDSFCCDVEWDGVCGEWATEVCGTNCGCVAPPVECCQPRNEGADCRNTACADCVCEFNSPCCDVVWDSSCAAAAQNACGGVCGCWEGSCCGSHDTAGCENTACADCVCAENPWCCLNLGWGPSCHELALGTCSADCGCTMGTESGCVVHTSPSADSAACTACVCEDHPECCTESWGETCVNAAMLNCTDSCGCVDDTNCCLPHSESGCGEPACQSCVCALDSFCCNFAWDSICVHQAVADCYPECSCGVAATECFEPLVLPQCGTPTTCDQCGETGGETDPACCLNVYQTQSFESGLAPWKVTSDQTGSGWAVKTSQIAFSGQKFLQTTLAAGTVTTDLRLRTQATWPSVVLPDADTIRLGFVVWTDVEPSASADNLSVWVTTSAGRFPVWSKMRLLEFSKWARVCIRLSAFAGQTVDIEFVFESGWKTWTAKNGMLVDDVAIRVSCEATAPSISEPESPPEAGIDCENGVCDETETCANCPEDCGECGECTPPPCLDPTRTLFVGGPTGQVCQVYSNNQTACEKAWHMAITGAASCFWDGDQCSGCGGVREGDGDCTNTCQGPVTCAGAPKRTLFAGDRLHGACLQYNNDALACEKAFHRGSTGIASCFYAVQTQECVGCGKNHALQGNCVNECLIDSPESTECPGDPTRKVVGGAPGWHGCSRIETEAECQQRFHYGKGGAASCYWDPLAQECLGCGQYNAQGGACLDACTACFPPSISVTQ
ncbi:MAG: hypothetical protein HUU55_18360 [Myxococcales bacterium]|nr:hypothetical protein [Myxococcales bacterium]